jgi:uncharacterized membrane protein
MHRDSRIVRILFALGMMSVGMLTLVYGYAVLVFSPPAPDWIPLLKGIGYASGVIMIGAGAGVLFSRTTRVATCVLLAFLLIWTFSRVPVVVSDPTREISWFAVGEIAVLAAGAMVLFARLVALPAGPSTRPMTREHWLLTARLLFALSLLTIGLSHFFEFAARTVSLVPAWLPYRTGWAYLTGCAQIAAGLGVLFSIYPRESAAMEAAMLSLFTLLVWVPAVFEKPKLASNWSEFLFTFALAGAAWVVAESMPATAS